MIRALFILIAVAAVIGLLLRLFLTTPPAVLAKVIRYSSGLLLVLGGAALLFTGQAAFAIPIIFAGIAILRGLGFRGQTPWGARKSPGHQSQVRSAAIEMTLDHDSGNMDGTVIDGLYEGSRLSDLGMPQLLELVTAYEHDTESLILLETYLDRVYPGWRDDRDGDAGARQGASPGSGSMSTQEAYQVLGLEPGASKAEVRAAHRRLMKQVHPDRGGSAILAAQINEAKERLLRQ